MIRSLVLFFLLVGQIHAWRYATPEELRRAVAERIQPVLIACEYLDQVVYSDIKANCLNISRAGKYQSTLTSPEADPLPVRPEDSPTSMSPSFLRTKNELIRTRKASQVFEPEWTIVGDAAKDANMMTIDCAKNRDTCIEMDVKAYPAIRLYHADGRVDRYRGPRKATP